MFDIKISLFLTTIKWKVLIQKYIKTFKINSSYNFPIIVGPMKWHLFDNCHRSIQLHQVST